jgi:hypothetical protein
MNAYLKLYGWLWEVFGRNEFSLTEFGSVFPSPQAKKVIHDLISDGYVERLERGHYRVREPTALVTGIVKENLGKAAVLERAERRYAYCCNDAVGMWTDGYYHTGFTRGFKPVHLEVLEKDVDYWRGFLKKNDAEYVVEGGKKTLFGLTYVLHPVKRIRSENKDGAPVVPLNETVRFCRENELTYRPALEYLDGKYGLGLFEAHEHLSHGGRLK